MAFSSDFSIKKITWNPDDSPLDVSPLDVSPLDVSPLDVSPLSISPLDVWPLDVPPQRRFAAVKDDVSPL